MPLTTKVMQQAFALKYMTCGNVAHGLSYNTLLLDTKDMGYYIRRGVVLHSTPGFYSYSVRLDDGTTVSCVPPNSGPAAVYGLGATECSVITPGTEVIVAQGRMCSAAGAIVCVVDNSVYSASGKLRNLKTDEGAGADSTVAVKAYSYDVLRQIHGNSVGIYKVSDTFPGEWAMFNEFGAGYMLGKTRATIRGSNMARIDLFPINDQVRIAAGYLQLFTHEGRKLVFADNGGYVSSEFLSSPYVWETAGCLTPAEFDKKLEVPEDTSHTLPKLENPDLARYREYTGSFAGGKQIFTSYPTQGSDGAVNVGLSHVAISDSGALVFRSVSDIIFSKTKQIDVPVRIRDPELRKANSTPEIPKKDESRVDAPWWAHDGGRRTASNVIKQQYKRFGANPNAWRMDSQEPKATYDNNSESSADIGSGTCQLALGADGSITLSTSGGAEIKLSGKDITISCPGTLSFRSGENTVAISKGDIISKAKGVVETIAKSGIVNSTEGAVSTFAKSSIYNEAGIPKEDKEKKKDKKKPFSAPAGIHFISNTDMISLDAPNIQVQAEKLLDIRSDSPASPQTTSRNSALSVAVGRISVHTYQSILNCGSSEKTQSGIVVSDDAVQIYGNVVNVLAGRTGSIILGRQQPAMQSLSDPATAADRYENLCKGYDSTRSRIMFERTNYLADLEHFSYRYTNVAVEESSWVNVLNPDSVDPWGEELTLNDTKPWPGAGKRVTTCRQDQSEFVQNDFGFGDKEAQDKAKPSIGSVEFSEFKG